MKCTLDEEDMRLASELIEACRQSGVHLATAESCTGGLIGATITAVAGASEVFWGGILSYQNEVKEQLLGVQATTLATVGAVSEACAGEMARGAQRALKAELALSATGIAGPGGATPEKPVGTVWIGVALRERVVVKGFTFEGDRTAVRLQTVHEALKLALETLKESE